MINKKLYFNSFNQPYLAQKISQYIPYFISLKRKQANSLPLTHNHTHNSRDNNRVSYCPPSLASFRPFLATSNHLQLTAPPSFGPTPHPAHSLAKKQPHKAPKLSLNQGIS